MEPHVTATCGHAISGPTSRPGTRRRHACTGGPRCGDAPPSAGGDRCRPRARTARRHPTGGDAVRRHAMRAMRAMRRDAPRCKARGRGREDVVVVGLPTSPRSPSSAPRRRGALTGDSHRGRMWRAVAGQGTTKTSPISTLAGPKVAVTRTPLCKRAPCLLHGESSSTSPSPRPSTSMGLLCARSTPTPRLIGPDEQPRIPPTRKSSRFQRAAAARPDADALARGAPPFHHQAPQRERVSNPGQPIGPIRSAASPAE